VIAEADSAPGTSGLTRGFVGVVTLPAPSTSPASAPP
jgi:hypothetical protein